MDRSAAIKPGRDLAIAIDLGGTQVRAALVSAEGRLLRRASMLTDVAGGPRAVLEQIAQMVATLCPGDELQDSVAGIGICAPGPLDSAGGTVIGIPTLPGWEQFPVAAVVAERFGCPALLENDGLAAAFGEWRYGAGRGLDHMLYVTVSTGLGGGVVSDRRLVRGRRGMACHIGHMKLSADGPICSCGAPGCFEAYASGSALGREGRQAAREHPASALGLLARQHELSGRDVVDAARAGDAIARGLMDAEARYLGAGFGSLLHLYSPELIVVGGGASQALDLMLDGMTAEMHRTVMPPFRGVPIVPAELGDNAGIIGVGSLLFHQA